ncbi:MAG: sulfatase-like hydrolase/transferase, partial [Deltaproteobacteria bacterium]
MHRALSAVLAFLLAPVWGLAAQRAATKTPPNVLLITLDTVRADHLGCYGYRSIKTPNIDELARVGARFDHA